MPRPLILRLCSALFMTLVLAVSLSATDSYAQSQKNPPSKNQQASMTAQQAAAQAKSSHGGKVLKVTRDRKGYKVKLLQDSGRVVIVKVGS
jgi:starvation-inducible outer membrane lipoprotein